MTESTSRRPAGEVAAACLLTAVGGFMDGYSYLGHGGVFASSQTGNVVFLAIQAISGDWSRAVRHLLPIIAFLFGAGVTHALVTHDARPAGVVYCLLVEACLLLAIGAASPWLPDVAVTIGISALAAVQTTSVTKADGWSYNSVMTTGNLRGFASAAEGFLLRDDPGRNQFGALILGLVCLAFFAGAAVGAVLTHTIGTVAITATMPIVLCAAALMPRC